MNANKYLVVLDCCRNSPGPGIQFKIEHRDEYEKSPDMNMTLVYSALRTAVAPDVPGKTMTSCLVKLLKGGEKIQVGRLQERLNEVWDETQMERSKRVMYTAEVNTTPRFEKTLFP